MAVFRAALQSWRGRPEGALRCAVIRHAQRADSECSIEGWARTPDAEQWPFDPPATEEGLRTARETASGELFQVADGSAPEGSWVVVSSPYLRCVQTAVQVCAALGPKASLLIDHSLGEVYGSEVMGDQEPAQVVRPSQQVRAYCEARGVALGPSSVGRWPAWPETVQAARGRLLKRFLQYLRRSALARRSFVLVTHADGVAAALAAMPSTNGRVVGKVDFCGFFVAESSPPYSPSSSASSPQQRSKVPESMGDLMEEDLNEVVPRVPSKWRVRHFGVQLGHRFSRSLAARLRSVARRTGYTEAELAALLQCLPEQALTDTSASDSLAVPAREGGDATSNRSSICSWSTYLFGASDAGGSGRTSPLPAGEDPQTSGVVCVGLTWEAFQSSGLRSQHQGQRGEGADAWRCGDSFHGLVPAAPPRAGSQAQTACMVRRLRVPSGSRGSSPGSSSRSQSPQSLRSLPESLKPKPSASRNPRRHSTWGGLVQHAPGMRAAPSIVGIPSTKPAGKSTTAPVLATSTAGVVFSPVGSSTLLQRRTSFQTGCRKVADIDGPA